MSIQGLSHITLGVKDLKKSRAFYASLFSVQPEHEEGGKDCHFIIGDLWFVLIKDDKAKPASGYTHTAFSVLPNDFEHISQKIKKNGAPIWQENKSFGQSLYFEDPDGHKLEIHAATWQKRFKDSEITKIRLKSND